MSNTYLYDGGFNGLLCIAFEAARRGDPAPLVVRHGAAQGDALFGETVRIETCPETARRVARALRDKGSDELVEKLRRIHRADHPDTDRALVRLIPRLAREGPDVFGDYGSEASVLAVRLHKAVCREIHRMHAFVRFEAQGDESWAARVEPLL